MILCFDHLSVLGPQYNEERMEVIHIYVCRSWKTDRCWNINVIHVEIVFTHEIGFNMINVMKSRPGPMHYG